MRRGRRRKSMGRVDNRQKRELWKEGGGGWSSVVKPLGSWPQQMKDLSNKLRIHLMTRTWLASFWCGSLVANNNNNNNSWQMQSNKSAKVVNCSVSQCNDRWSSSLPSPSACCSPAQCPFPLEVLSSLHYVFFIFRLKVIETLTINLTVPTQRARIFWRKRDNAQSNKCCGLIKKQFTSRGAANLQPKEVESRTASSTTKIPFNCH